VEQSDPESEQWLLEWKEFNPWRTEQALKKDRTEPPSQLTSPAVHLQHRTGAFSLCFVLALQFPVPGDRGVRR